jgi:cytochrome c oxidase subunit II
MESRNHVVWIINATLLVALLVSVGAALFAKPETAGERIVAINVKCFEDGPEDSTHKKGVPLILQLSSLDVPDGFNPPDLKVRADAITGKPAKVHVVSPQTGRFTSRCDIDCGGGREQLEGTIVAEQ